MTRGSTILNKEKQGEGPPMDLLPTDQLPPEAARDPLFDAARPRFAKAQDPELARKYGVLRNGIRVRFDVPGPVPSAEPPSPAPVTEAPSIVSKKTEVPKPEETAPEPEPQEPQGEGEAEGMGAMDLARVREIVTENVLNNHEQRLLVESRLKGKILLADMLLNRPVRQTVVIDEDLRITFEAVPYQVELANKQQIATEAANAAVFNEYLNDKFILYGVAASIYAINDNPVQSMYVNGKFDWNSLEAKFQWMLKLPIPLITMFSIQYHWFFMRLQNAVKAKQLKNG